MVDTRRTMSFDVSSVATGWSVLTLSGAGSKATLIDFGVVRIPSELDLQSKLVWFKHHVSGLLLVYKPDDIVIEETYLKNVKTLKTLTQFIGVLHLLCGELLGLTPCFVSPNTVRSYYKLATKEDAFDYVRNNYKVKLKNLTFEDGNDITDSILQGLYWIYEGRYKEKKK